jgi:type IV secretory pathway TraG/TraD family ATPase VirD4
VKLSGRRLLKLLVELWRRPFASVARDYDAEHRIARPSTSPHLPPHLAALTRWSTLSRVCFDALAGVVCCVLMIWATENIGFESDLYKCGYGLGFLFLIFGGITSVENFLPYTRFFERATYGSAQWATPDELRDVGLARPAGSPRNAGDLVLGTLHNGDEFFFPLEQVMSHACVVGPPGSGKSVSMIYNALLSWAESGSVIVLDPKGELFGMTSMHYRNVYRFDLSDPSRSDRWDFVAACRDDAEFADEAATLILGVGSTKKTEGNQKFWDRSETAGLTAILLHLAETLEQPAARMISEFIAKRSIEEMQREMCASDSRKARMFWGIFNKAKDELLGNIVTGIGVVCKTFMLDNVAAVMRPLTEEEKGKSGEQYRLFGMGRAHHRPVRNINLEDLRKPGTAIYIVVPEGEAARYEVVVSTFLAMANSVLRKSSKFEAGAAKPSPALFMMEEAGNLPLYSLKEMLGVGRGRRIGVLTFYQDIPQIYAMFGQEEGGAVLDMYGAKILLPGAGIATAEYFAKCIGDTTVQKHTSVDARGSRFDNERLSDVQRRLIDATELRQLPKYREAVAIVSTHPPIRFRFPERCQLEEGEFAVMRPVELPQPRTLEDAELQWFLDDDKKKKLVELGAGNAPAREAAPNTQPEAKARPSAAGGVAPPQNAPLETEAGRRHAGGGRGANKARGGRPADAGGGVNSARAGEGGAGGGGPDGGQKAAGDAPGDAGSAPVNDGGLSAAIEATGGAGVVGSEGGPDGADVAQAGAGAEDLSVEMAEKRQKSRRTKPRATSDGEGGGAESDKGTQTVFDVTSGALVEQPGAGVIAAAPEEAESLAGVSG